MVTSVTSFGRSGLYDWFVQRASAVILLTYFLFLGWTLVSGVDYSAWKALFQQTWMRVFSLLALISLCAHAWVGLWTVFTDYLTQRLLGAPGSVLRLSAEAISALIMFTYLIWGIQILWSS
jgi:succinate dehydrogenase / fumarate reductase membrane anchor subunit